MDIEYGKGPEISFECESDPISVDLVMLQNVITEIDRARNNEQWARMDGFERAAWFELLFRSIKRLHENGYFDKKEVSE